MATKRKHLWETEHPYYCNDANYYAADCRSEWSSWAEFFADEGNADKDYNLLFRWDWEGSVLKLYFMGQRKGKFRIAHVAVDRTDEPAIRKWLRGRWRHLRRLWAPLAGA